MNEKMREAEVSEVKSGLTWRTLLALLAAMIIFIPVNLYTSLLIGAALGGVAVYFIIILFSQLSELFGNRLSVQEVMLIYYAVGWGVSLPAIQWLMYGSYFVNSPFAQAFTIQGKPIASLVPSWLIPSPGSPAYDARSFFHPAFYIPVLIWTSYSLFSSFGNLVISMIFAQIYVENLKYPFPLAIVDIATADFLGRRPREFAKYFMVAISVGVLWGLISYVLRMVPLPFLDLTRSIEEFFPCALFGLSTTLSSYVTGLVIPFDASAYMLVASLIIWILFNSLFVTTYPNIFPEWAQEYQKGLGFIAIQSRSSARVWFGPQLGFTLAISIFMLFKARKGIVAIFKEFFIRGSDSVLEFPSMRWLFLLYLGVTLGSVVWFQLLVPDVPVWLSLFCSVGFSFLIAVSMTAMQGEVGFTTGGTIIWSWNAFLYMTPYQGYEGFQVTPAILGTSSPSFAQQVKSTLAVKLKPISLVKVWIIATMGTIIIGLIAMDIFWRIAPIPSSAYPASMFSYPQSATTDAMIVSRALRIDFEHVMTPALILLLIAFTGDFISTKTGLPFSILGLTIGLFMTPPFAIATFVGSFLGRFVITRFFKEWDKVRGYVVSGEMFGEGLMVVAAVALTLITKGSWLWPW